MPGLNLAEFGRVVEEAAGEAGAEGQMAGAPGKVEAVTEEAAAEENVRLEGRGIRAEIKPSYPDGTVFSIGDFKFRVTLGSDGRMYLRPEIFRLPGIIRGVLRRDKGIEIPRGPDGGLDLIDGPISESIMEGFPVDAFWDPDTLRTVMKIPFLDVWENHEDPKIGVMLVTERGDTINIETSDSRNLVLTVPADVLVSSYAQPEGLLGGAPMSVYRPGAEETVVPAESAAADDRGERAVETVIVERRVDEGERKSAEVRFSENAGRVAGLKHKGGENFDLTAEETDELVDLFGETMETLAEMFEKNQRLTLGGKSRTAMELFRMVNEDRSKLARSVFRRIPDSLSFDDVDIAKDNRKFAERVEREEDAVGRRVFLESRFREIANWAGNIKRGLGNFQTIEDKQLGQEGMELYLLQKGAMEALARMFEEGVTLELGGKSRTAMELFRMVNSEMSGLEKELARRVSAGR